MLNSLQQDDSRLTGAGSDPLSRLLEKWAGSANLTKLLVFLVSLCLILQLNSHFWLDETVSYWTANGGFGQIVSRCTTWPHSILYSFLFLWFRSLGAAQPWLYRLPSFLGVAGATVLLFRLARRLFSREIAWIAVAVFVSLQPVQFAAGDARPYGLGLFATVLSTELLLRLIERPGYRLAALYGVTAGLILHFHLVFGAVLAVHLLYFLACFLAGRRIPAVQAVIAVVVLAVVAAPLIPQYGAAFRDAKIHSVAARPGLADLLKTYFPEASAIALIATGVVLMISAPRVRLALPAHRLDRGLAVLWALAPPILLFAVSKVSAAQVFAPRYLLTFSPGFAICLAALITSVQIRLLNRLVLCALIVLAAAPLKRPSQISHARFLGDWAEAVALVDRETAVDHSLVLLRSQFIESDFLPLEPVQDNPLFSQLTFYPTKSQIVPLSRSFQKAQIARLEHFLATKLTSSSRRFFFMFHGDVSAADSIVYYLLGRLGPRWHMRTAGDFDGVMVTEFYRV